MIETPHRKAIAQHMTVKLKWVAVLVLQPGKLGHSAVSVAGARNDVVFGFGAVPIQVTL